MSDDESVLTEIRAMYPDRGFHSHDSWRDAPAIYDDHSLTILNHPVMEDWEKPYMLKLAQIATSRGGRVLEIGYGMGISAGYIAHTDILSHTIIEANREVAKRAEADIEARRTDPDRPLKHAMELLEGLWEDVIEKIPDGSLDGILYDAYPLDESQIMKQVRFAPTAFRKLADGGVFTYFSDEIDRFQPEHLQQLVDAGFEPGNISGEAVPVQPPVDCAYWKSSKIWAPIVVKGPAVRELAPAMAGAPSPGVR